MKKGWLLILITCCLLLSGCARIGSLPAALEATAVPGVSDPMPAAEAPESRSSSAQSVLWFRFESEECLAPAYRTINYGLNEAYELALVRALIAGPDVRSTGLSGLFPNGVRALSTSLEGRTLFVTFSEELLNGYADEPANWDTDSYWSKEIPLRRQLCMQSLAATLTENCDVDRVQVMVQSDSGEARRLTLGYYPETNGEVLPADPLWRDETLLLTPQRTAGIILTALSNRDWQKLYLYIFSDSGERQEYADFVVSMEQLPQLTAWTLSGGSASEDGRRFIFSLQGTVLLNGHTSRLENRILRLHREEGVWKTSVELLQFAVEVSYER